jgi:hypothetical protein
MPRRAITIMEDTFNELLLILFLYFGIVFACYGFLLINVSNECKYSKKSFYKHHSIRFQDIQKYIYAKINAIFTNFYF